MAEKQFLSQQSYIFSKPSPWTARKVYKLGGGLSLERSEKNGGPGACPRKFLEIHHIECRKTPHYATFSRPLSDRPVLESSSKRLVSKQAVSLINSEFEEKRSVILIVIWSITCLKTSHKTSEQPGVSSRLTSQGL